MPEQNLEQQQEQKDEYTKSAAWVESIIKADNTYKQRMQLPQKWKVFEDFRNSKQWPAVVKGTEDLPRPVFNVVKFIEDHKVNSVKNSTIKVVYSNPEGDYVDEAQGLNYQDAESVDELADKFTTFYDKEAERLKLEQLHERVLHTSCNKGLGISHYIFDDRLKGGRKLKWKGGIAVETLSPPNVIFGNPNDIKIESQPYIGVKSRMLVSQVKREAKNNNVKPEDILRITADKDTKDRIYDAAQIENDDIEAKCNVITVYFKAPVKSISQEEQTDEAGNTVTVDVETEEDYVFYQRYASGVVFGPAVNTGRKYYPIAIMPWDEVEDSIFAKAEPDGMINNQRIINLILACMAKSVENSGFPKIKYKEDSVDLNDLNSMIGGFVKIKGQANDMNSVDYMQPGQISSVAENLVEIFMQYTKTLAGATETSTGELSATNAMNATAISLLQKASGIPIDGIRNRYYQYIEDEALIMADFFKTNYTTARLVSYNDENSQRQTMLFRGTDAKDVDFVPRIDVGPAANYSELQVVATLQQFVQAGYITFDQLLKYAPKNYIPYKEQLIKEREEMAQQQAQEEDALMVHGMNDAEKQIYNSAPAENQQAMLQKLRMDKKLNMQQMMNQQAMMNPKSSKNNIPGGMENQKIPMMG